MLSLSAIHLKSKRNKEELMFPVLTVDNEDILAMWATAFTQDSSLEYAQTESACFVCYGIIELYSNLRGLMNFLQ